MAILARDRRACSRSHMCEEKVRAQMPAKVTEILIRPSRAKFPVKARLRVLSVPPEPKTIAVRGSCRLQRMKALRDQRMRGLSYIIGEGDWVSPIGNPSAHSRSPEKLFV